LNLRTREPEASMLTTRPPKPSWSKVRFEEEVQMIHHQLRGPAVTSHPKSLNLNLRNPGHSAVAARTCVQNLRTMPLDCVS
jgi:hypothetical protein